MQDYGFRLYNPSIARFLSVDPLSISYPSWTPFSFAMNRVIDGIDLDGLEYLSNQESRLFVTTGRVRLNLANFSNNFVNDFNNRFDPAIYSLDHRIDGIGGLRPNPLDVFTFGSQQSVEEYDNFIPRSRQINNAVRVQHTKNLLAPPPGANKSIGKGIGLVNLIIHAAGFGHNYMLNEDGDLLQKHKKAFNNAYKDLKTALEEGGYIPPKFNNLSDVSEVLNFVFQAPNFVFISEKNSGQVVTTGGKDLTGNVEHYKVAMKIASEISKNVEIEEILIVYRPNRPAVTYLKGTEQYDYWKGLYESWERNQESGFFEKTPFLGGTEIDYGTKYKRVENESK